MLAGAGLGMGMAMAGQMQNTFQNPGGQQQQAPQPNTPQTGMNANMVTCGGCKASVAMGKFCSECGGGLEAAGPKFCSSCGKPVEGKFCSGCGTSAG